MKKFAVLAGCLFLLRLQVAEADEAQLTHPYRGWFDDTTLSIKEPPPESTEGWLIGEGGRVVRMARFCDPDSIYFCFSSESYVFAVPKSLQPEVGRWTVDNLTFEVVRRRIEISLFGSRISGLLLIRLAAGADYGGKPTDRDTYYLYSPARGLVAFGFDPAQPYSTTWWMEDDVGFGAGSRR